MDGLGLGLVDRLRHAYGMDMGKGQLLVACGCSQRGSQGWQRAKGKAEASDGALEGGQEEDEFGEE